MVWWVGMYECSPKHRRALLGRLSGARTESEISEAERAAVLYLERYPHDSDVVVAAEKLEKRAAKIRDPERGANRWSVAIFVGLAALITLVVFAYARAWVPAVLVGVPIAGLVAEGVWDALLARAERKEARRGGSGSG